MPIELRDVPFEQMREFLAPITTALGHVPSDESVARWEQVPELGTRIGAFDGDRLVGGAGSFDFELTVPGGAVDAGGLTMVGVAATHTRQGILTSMMRRAFEAARAKGQPVSCLWASEGTIYGRYGYGVSTLGGRIMVDRDRSAFAQPLAREGTARLVAEDEALRVLPLVYDRVRRETPGMLSRSQPWWKLHTLYDPPSDRRGGALQRVVLELDGEPQAYALYRQNQEWRDGTTSGILFVHEALGATPRATAQLWRYLFDVDLLKSVEAWWLPLDHPLLLLVAEPRRLQFTLGDVLWTRLLDVGAALAARGHMTDDPVVLEVEDAFLPENAGRWTSRGERTDAAADLRLDVSVLGSAYLGGFTFARLAEAGRVEELTDGAIERADRACYSPRAPWCPEIF